MHIAILTYGSRGDVQPFVVLALALQKKGHTVTIAAAENFKDFIEGYGLRFYSLQGNVQNQLHTPQAVKMLKTGNTIAFIRHLQKVDDETRPQINKVLLEVCSKADALITSTLNIFYVAAIAEKLHKKWAMIIPNPPGTPTREYPVPDLDFLNFPSYNLFSYHVLAFAYWQAYKKRINAFRVSIGLAPATKNMLYTFNENKILTLYNFSPQLIHQPKDWESHSHITGFLPLENKMGNDDPPADLIAWIANGTPPLYIGFGSIPVPDPALLADILVEILSSTNHRIVFCKGWSRLNALPIHKNLFIAEQVNHEWLLPKCKVAIFHGGAGTLAATLKAKIPAIIVSIFGDQPMWGKVVQRKKIGIHIPFKKLTSKKLLDAIEQTQTPSFINNAFETGEKVNAENGVDNAVEKLEAYFG